MEHRVRFVLAATTMIAAISFAPARASACGGCFAPPNPTGTVSVVNAHRMAFLASPRGSVLWDQIQYTGAPADFVWVLPVMGTPQVEVADNAFFEALVATTNITLVAPAPPRTFCPSQCCGCYGAGAFASDASASDGGAARDGATVSVFHEAVVGPYDTATIGSTSPSALVDWLHAHGYEVSNAMLPTIAYYVGLGMNFVALRLAPNAGVDRMTPVRIHIPGLALTLPLRMVAAGIGSEVELELFVFAESRMQTASFPNADVDRAAITFDWASRRFDYDARFDDALFRGTGALNNWVSEYAQAVTPYSYLSYYYRNGYRPDAGAPTVSDIEIVNAALDAPYLTRLRTRLPPSQLATDLTLESSRGADILNRVDVTHELNRPADIVCAPLPPCPGTLHATGSGCSASNGAGAGIAWIAILALVLAWRVRSRSAAHRPAARRR